MHVCAPVPSTKRSGVPSALKPSSATSPSIPAQAWVLPGRVDWFYIGQARSFPPPSEGTKGKLARAWVGGGERHREPPLGGGERYGRMPTGAGSVALSERVDDTPPRPSPVAQTFPRRVSDIMWHSVEFLNHPPRRPPIPRPPTSPTHRTPTPYGWLTGASTSCHLVLRRFAITRYTRVLCR